jgi:putative transposase
MKAYLHGLSTRKVDNLVKALGADTGISESEVSRICAAWTRRSPRSGDRPLVDMAFPHVFLDVTYCEARSTGGSCPRPSPSPPAWPPTGTAKSSGRRR